MCTSILEPRGSVKHTGEKMLVDTTTMLRGSFSRSEGPVVADWYGDPMTEKRYVGKCKGCKRSVSTLLPAIVREKREYLWGREQVSRWAEVYIYGPSGVESWTGSVNCPDCGGRVALQAVKGKVSPDVRCDARCTGARGPNCECSCGGVNHGADWS